MRSLAEVIDPSSRGGTGSREASRNGSVVNENNDSDEHTHHARVRPDRAEEGEAVTCRPRWGPRRGGRRRGASRVCGTDLESFTGEMAHLHQGVASYPTPRAWAGTVSASRRPSTRVDGRVRTNRLAPVRLTTNVGVDGLRDRGLFFTTRNRGSCLLLLPRVCFAVLEREGTRGVDQRDMAKCLREAHQALGLASYSDSPTSLHRPNSRSNTSRASSRRPIRA